MISCVFPGSFDPVTVGHLDLIGRAASLFDHVTVTIMNNIRKTGTVPAEERLRVLKKACHAFPNVSVDLWEGLLADYMREKGERIIIRGLRSGSEFDQEYPADTANKAMNGKLETIFLPASPGLTFISSSTVREIHAFGGDIRPFIPESVTEEIIQLLSKNMHQSLSSK